MQGRKGKRLVSTVTAEPSIEIALVEHESPAPGADEVLIRVEAAPINPSDLGVMLAAADPGQARAGGDPERPCAGLPISAGALAALRERLGDPLPLGNEGAGTVVEAGGGAAAKALLGRVVAVADGGGGMYSELRLAKASDCLPLPDGTSAEQGAASFVNPMTALAMVETMRLEGHTALLHTAAASGLGKMLNRLCLEDGIPLVCVVRSPGQVETLRRAGAMYVLDSTADNFERELVSALRETGATLAFDAIGGGSLADRVLDAMERAIAEGGGFHRYGSDRHKQVYLYGMLDRSPTVLRRSYGMAWGVGGWLLPPALQRLGPQRVAELRRRVAENLKTTFATEYTDRVTLVEALAPEAIASYGRPRTGTKFLITPHA
jgi:NADPH:quinone reductase-like Zn-dependent oxidoreductase